MERCYKLSLSVDLLVAMARSEGTAVESGVKTGLLGLNDTVTQHGRRFGIEFRHTNMIDALRQPMHYREVMVDGVFDRFEHEHHFALMNDGTRMRDEVRFTAPMGRVGWVAEKFWLRRYLVQVLKQRSTVMKWVAESQEWRRYLGDEVQVERLAKDVGGVGRTFERSASGF